MKIYTKTGDKGTTSLFDGTRVSKNNLRVDTYGSVDELNSQIGVVIAHLENKDYEKRMRDVLWKIQDDLLNIGSILADPSSHPTKAFVSHLLQEVDGFEKYIDQMTAEMPELSNFIMPGGKKAAAFLHTTRTIARRVERRIISLMQKENIEKAVVMYFNRLSDLFFTMSRYVNFKEGQQETIWTAYTPEE